MQNVEANGPERMTVTLADGRTHHWRVEGLDAEQDRTSSVRFVVWFVKSLIEKNIANVPQ